MFILLSLFSAPAHADADPLLLAIGLPEAAHRLRLHGVDDVGVRDALQAARDKKLSAGDARAALDAADVVIAERGPIDNFGTFVRQQLDEGKRGKDLAAAIRAEHVSRGKGKGVGWKEDEQVETDAEKTAEKVQERRDARRQEPKVEPMTEKQERDEARAERKEKAGDARDERKRVRDEKRDVKAAERAQDKAEAEAEKAESKTP